MSESILILQKVGVFELNIAGKWPFGSRIGHCLSNVLYALKYTAYQSLSYSLLIVNTLPKEN